MNVVFWGALLIGSSVTILGSIVALGVSNLSLLMPLWWLGSILQGLLLAFCVEKPFRWQTFILVVIAIVFPLPLALFGSSVGILPAISLRGAFFLFGFQSLFMVGQWWLVSRKPQTFVYLFSSYPPDTTLSYDKWAAEEIARLNLNTTLEGIERFFFWLVLLSVLVSSIGVLVNKTMQLHLTMGWILLFFGVWGSWYRIHEMGKIFGWKMQGLSLEQAPQTISSPLVLLILLLCMGIGFLLPNRFVLISLESIGERFRASVRQTEIQLQTSDVPESSAQTNTVTPSEETTLHSFPPAFWWFIRGIGVFLGVYLFLGFTGYFFERYWSYRPKNALIRWLIAFYKKNQFVFQIISFVITLFFTLLFTITGISLLQKQLEKRKKKKEGNEEIRQQLYALFESSSATSDEKREEIMTIVKYFVMLIETASSRILPYRPSYGPLEYIEKLVDNLPSLRENLLWIVSIFNESRYSLHLLESEKKNSFTQTVEMVIGEISK